MNRVARALSVMRVTPEALVGPSKSMPRECGSVARRLPRVNAPDGDELTAPVIVQDAVISTRVVTI